MTKREGGDSFYDGFWLTERDSHLLTYEQIYGLFLDTYNLKHI